MRSLHWGGECGFILRALDGHEVLQYSLPAAWGLFEDGGHEFAVVLERRPVSNVLRFGVRSWGLDVFPQPDGSHAAYHSSRAGNFEHPHAPWADRHYRAGKAFHVLRPWAEDAAGYRVNCELYLPANGVSVLTVPEWFLKDAEYPVLVDPTFGYTTAGGTHAVFAATAICSFVSQLTAAGGETVSDINAYIDDGSSGLTAGVVAVYAVSGTTPGARVGSNAAITISGSPQWRTASGLSLSLSASTNYSPAAGGNDPSLAPGFYRDSASGPTLAALRTSDGTLPSSWGSNEGTSQNKYSIYATYSLAAAAVPRPLVVPNAAAQRAASW